MKKNSVNLLCCGLSLNTSTPTGRASPLTLGTPYKSLYIFCDFSDFSPTLELHRPWLYPPNFPFHIILQMTFTLLLLLITPLFVEDKNAKKTNQRFRGLSSVALALFVELFKTGKKKKLIIPFAWLKFWGKIEHRTVSVQGRADGH